MEIKKVLFFTASLFLSLSQASCTVPGTYMRTGQIHNSTHTLAGRLTNTKIIPINLCLLQQAPDKFISAATDKNYPYLVGPNDLLNITVWNHPELTMPTSQTAVLGLNNNTTSQFKTTPPTTGINVSSDGKIFFPFAGNLYVAGKTTSQVENLLAKKLALYIRNPQISIRIAAFNSQRVNLIGEIQKPGIQPLTNRPLSLLDAINTAGGIDNKIADSAHIYVFRNNFSKNKISIYWLNGQNPQGLLLAERFRLVDNDIVYISPAGLPSFNRILAQLLPTLQTIWYTNSLVKNF